MDRPAAVAPAGTPPVTSGEGLAADEAARRLARDGPNVIPHAARFRAWRNLALQMVHFFALLLWVAGALAFVAGMPVLGTAIFIVIVVNGLFAFAQEFRAERATERLGALLPRRATVMRDGRERTIDVAELVTGDLVILAAGDRVSADAEVVHADALALDTSIITGESVASEAGVGDTVLAGMFVVTGDARATVTATGPRTRLASIVGLARSGRRPPAPLARELERVVRTVALIATGVGALFFLTAWLVGTPARDGFLFAIGVTVALVPEGLLPTVTLSLAAGAQRMAGHRALVRRLDAVETLGATTFICTDKTGTLTLNQMSVIAAWTPAGGASAAGRGYDPAGDVRYDAGAEAAIRELAWAGVRCSDGRAREEGGRWVAAGDPMEAAIDVFARRAGLDTEALLQDEPELARLPFDPERRLMSVFTGRGIYVKGAPEALLHICAGTEGAEAAVDAFARRGLRVIAVAHGAGDPSLGLEAERDLELLGLLGLEDPPRPGVAEAIAACRDLGVRVAMLTGDHPTTAEAIGREIGLVNSASVVVEGANLPADLEVLGAMIDRDGVVISRASPEDKVRIAEALQRRGHVVAMTGDGVNDGPALLQADVGVAMGSGGTDVAREAAALVLLDDDFSTIVRAIAEGRTTFANIRRFLTYHLTDNVAEVTPFIIWALSGGRFPLALGVIQILCLDIGTDLLPALALGSEPPRPHTAAPLRGQRLIDGRLLRRVFGVLGPTEAVVEMLAFLTVLVAAGWRPGDSFPGGRTLEAASGAAFMAVVVGQAANAFACRSTRQPPWVLSWWTNRLLLVAVIVELALLAAFLLLPPVADALDHRLPPWEGLLVALLAIPAVLAADAAHKAWRTRPRQAQGTRT